MVNKKVILALVLIILLSGIYLGSSFLFSTANVGGRQTTVTSDSFIYKPGDEIKYCFTVVESNPLYSGKQKLLVADNKFVEDSFVGEGRVLSSGSCITATAPDKTGLYESGFLVSYATDESLWGEKVKISNPDSSTGYVWSGGRREILENIGIDFDRDGQMGSPTAMNIPSYKVLEDWIRVTQDLPTKEERIIFGVIDNSEVQALDVYFNENPLPQFTSNIRLLTVPVCITNGVNCNVNANYVEELKKVDYVELQREIKDIEVNPIEGTNQSEVVVIVGVGFVDDPFTVTKDFRDGEYYVVTRDEDGVLKQEALSEVIKSNRYLLGAAIIFVVAIILLITLLIIKRNK